MERVAADGWLLRHLTIRTPAGAVAGQRYLSWPCGARVRERGRAYEDEGSVREARGAVAAQRDAWWSAALSVAIVSGHGADGAANVRLERHGPISPGQASGGPIDITVPCAELDAIVVLLSGLVAQARRDGVTP